MKKFLVQITEYHGEFIDADTFEIDYSDGIIKFIINTPIGGTNPPKIVGIYNLLKIYGFREI